MIRRDQPGLSLSRRCGLLSISRSSFYYASKDANAENLELMRRIEELFPKYPFYGSHQMVRQLRREGVHVGRHRVRRVMRLMGLEAIYLHELTVGFYNTDRLHSALGGRTPAEAYAAKWALRDLWI